MLLYVLPLLVGVTVLVAATGVVRLTRREDKIEQRLRRIRGLTLNNGESLEKVLAGRTVPFWLQPLRFLGSAMPLPGDTSRLRLELAAAGYRHVEGPRIFTGFRLFCAIVFAVATFFVTPQFRLLRTEVWVVTGAAALVGFMFPWLLVRLAQRRRRMEITLALPDALDLMVVCVEAGQGLNAALMSVAREASTYSPALSDELRLMNLEMSTGLPRATALRNLARRTGIDDMRALVAVLVQSDKFGTSIGGALRVHARSLRTRRRQRAEEAARKTPVKMVFPLVFCIFPALLVVILAPGVIELVRALRDVNG